MTTTQIDQIIAAGIAHHLAGRLDAATEQYSRVLETLPQRAEAWRLLGVVALQSGDGVAARSLLERAIRIDSQDAAAHCALGNVNEADGKLDAAYTAYAAARAIDATEHAAVVGLTRAALGLGRPAEAITIAEAALAGGTIDARLLRALGAARAKLRNYAGAADAFRASIEIQPHADAYANLAIASMRQNRIDDAVVAANRALELDPTHAEAANTLGCAHAANAAFPAAFKALARAVELGSEEAHSNLGTGRLLLGEYHEGWPHYGWANVERRVNPISAALPMWDGTAAPGRRLLIWPEQGIGDTIQMARFLRQARDLVGTVTLACPPGTRELFGTVNGIDMLVETRVCPPLETFDLWLPTIRLPVVFDAALASIPSAPYMHSDPARVERFRPLLQAPGRLRVGLVWSGNPSHERDDLRSCALAELDTLHDVPGVAWFALQQGAPREQRARNMQLIPINAEVTNFADTAAIIGQLDLVITVDTSVAHLAGALGTPAWVLIAKRPDWRWQLAGEVSPWYPTLRLFRQGPDGTWAPVIAALAVALQELRERTIGAAAVA